MNYTQEELKDLLGSVGPDVRVHKSVVFFNPKNIFIGSHVRIDCFGLLSAGSEGIHINNHIHIGAGTYLFGGGGKIHIDSFANISSRVSLFTSNDDYTDGFMSNPMVPEEFKKMQHGSIYVHKHVIIGTNSVILPNVTLNLGAAVGALSLVKKSVESFAVVCGTPAVKVKERGRKLLELEEQLTSL